MISLIVIVACCVVSMSSAYPLYPGYPYYPHGGNYYNQNYYWGHPGYYSGLHGAAYHGAAYPYAHFPHHYGVTPGSRLIYYGEFKGSCDGAPDGLYYVDEYSFAYCSNGQKTIQPCAEGSANPPVAHFKNGGYYGLYDFCAVNLVAQGYTAHKPAVAPVYKPAVVPGYHAEQPKEEHYTEEKTYVVEEQGYGGDNKVEGYEETRHYEEPPKKY